MNNLIIDITSVPVEMAKTNNLVVDDALAQKFQFEEMKQQIEIQLERCKREREIQNEQGRIEHERAQRIIYERQIQHQQHELEVGMNRRISCSDIFCSILCWLLVLSPLIIVLYL